MKKEDMAGLRQRQQEELEKNAQEKKEVLRQRRLAHTTEHEQRFQSKLLVPLTMTSNYTRIESFANDPTLLYFVLSGDQESLGTRSWKKRNLSC